MSFKNAGTSPTVGIRHVVYWLMTQNDNLGAAYGPAYPLPGAMTAKVTHAGDSQNVSADDQIDEVIYGQGSDDVELQQKNIPLDDLARLLGHQIVDGVMVRNKDDIAPEIAFAYQSAKSNGAIEYDKYLCGRFSEPDKEHESNGEKVAPKFKTIKGSFYPRKSDGNSSKQMESDSATFNAAKVDTWFTNVDDATPSAIALSSSNPTNNATGAAANIHPVLTFNNAISDYSGIQLLNVTDNAAISFTASLDGTKKVLTITPGANLITAKKYDIILVNVTDVYLQKLAAQLIGFTIA